MSSRPSVTKVHSDINKPTTPIHSFLLALYTIIKILREFIISKVVEKGWPLGKYWATFCRADLEDNHTGKLQFTAFSNFPQEQRDMRQHSYCENSSSLFNFQQSAPSLHLKNHLPRIRNGNVSTFTITSSNKINNLEHFLSIECILLLQNWGHSKIQNSQRLQRVRRVRRFKFDTCAL